jgi:hypothetical protein
MFVELQDVTTKTLIFAGQFKSIIKAEQKVKFVTALSQALRHRNACGSGHIAL